MSDQDITQAGSDAAVPRRASRLIPLGLALFCALAAIAVGLSLGAGPTDGWQLAARYTARVSAGLFLLVFLMAPLARSPAAPAVRPLLPNRRYWGLSFALAHAIHLGALITFFQVSGQAPPLPTLIVGGVGYMLVAFMALTSTDRARAAMGRSWTRLHTFGLYYVWFVFTITYALRIPDDDRGVIGLVGLPVFVLALALRLHWRKPR